MNKIIKRENITSNERKLYLFWSILFLDKLWSKIFKNRISKKFKFTNFSIDRISWLIDNYLKILNI